MSTQRLTPPQTGGGPSVYSSRCRARLPNLLPNRFCSFRKTLFTNKNTGARMESVSVFGILLGVDLTRRSHWGPDREHCGNTAKPDLSFEGGMQD